MNYLFRFLFIANCLTSIKQTVEERKMIQALWIITETGQCIFSHKYVQLDIDDQLISGLLVAFDAFSSESGIGGIQQIAGEDNQFVYGSSGKVLVAALADKRDNEILVEKLTMKIADIFQQRYSGYLADISFVDLNVFNGFEREIDNVLRRKAYNRGVGSTIFGTIVSLALTVGMFLLLLDIIIQASFLVFLAFIPGLFIGALVAGKSSYGIITTSITILPIIGFIAYLLWDIGDSSDIGATINSIFLMTVTYLTIALLCGVLGGGIIDRRRLFPIVKGKEVKLAVVPQVVATPDQVQTYQEEVYSVAEAAFQTSEYYQEETLPPPPETYDQQTEWDQQ
jgi:hypothetical protein